MTKLTDDLTFLRGAASDVAPRLLGCILERKIGNETLRVRIVETEAYDQSDVASHSYKGKTERTEVMFGPAGRLYVYFTYGMHYCCNIVVSDEGYGAAVLMRAVEPLEGVATMESSRHKSGVEITNGPAKLCQALSITKDLNGHDLTQNPLRLISQPPLSDSKIVQTTRVGISQGTDVPWRFFIKDHLYVSRPV